MTAGKRAQASTARKAAPARAEQDVTPEQYNAFITGVQLRHIELAQVSARAERSDLSELAVRVGSHFMIKSSGQNDTAFTVEASLQLDFVTDEDVSLGEFSCLYRLEYGTEIPLNDAIFKVFSERNVPLNIWPFLRELVMSTTQRFGWSGFVLPAYKVPTFSTSAAPTTDVPARTARPRGATRKAAAPKPAKV